MNPLLAPVTDYYKTLKNVLQQLDNTNEQTTNPELREMLRLHKNNLNQLIDDLDKYKNDANSSISHIQQLLSVRRRGSTTRTRGGNKRKTIKKRS